ncbi:pilus assembly protein TadG-related protein [Agrobacterium sp. SOY23]|uniref:pilus assembly protein TadG-related protein n=1 Tax=Agrobacterium sp. SOY23 TaxID=3014555 RepID=UPI0022B0278C|nr:pilus assembly protein TadG-related protein [Agrobacterium sp. SOY23]MCZ4430113.1 pilus assembly protein TadG-related protein [Agrobacterium sp. SOY23]
MKNIWQDESGNFGILSALLMVPLIGVAGVALDVTHGMAVKSDLQMAADAAALAVVADTSASVKAAKEMSGDGVISLGSSEASAFFEGNQRANADYKLLSLDISVIKHGNVIESSVSFTASVGTTLSQVLAKDLITVSGKATAKYETETFSDFYVLLDNTPSMGVGATPADVATMVANTSDKCAFACHIVKNGVVDTGSYYYRAKSLGVTTRINVVAQATASLMDTAKATRKSSNQYRMAVYTFGEKAEDTKLLEVVPLTSDLATAKKKAGEVDLMSIPYQGYNNDQQTDFDRALIQIGDKIGSSGTGASSASPDKIIFFVSDGVGDSYKPSTCTKKTTSGRCQEPIDIKYCTKLKEKGFRIAVLYTTYLPLPTNDWYNSWIKPFQSEIGARMQTCASPGLFFEVSPSQGISDAMSALFKKAITSPRLTG